MEMTPIFSLNMTRRGTADVLSSGIWPGMNRRRPSTLNVTLLVDWAPVCLILGYRQGYGVEGRNKRVQAWRNVK